MTVTGSIETMTLLEQVTIRLDQKHGEMCAQLQSVGRLSELLEAKGGEMQQAGNGVRRTTERNVEGSQLSRFGWDPASIRLFCAADAIRDKLQVIDDVDEELTELEDMVDQLEQYTSALRTWPCECESVRGSRLES